MNFGAPIDWPAWIAAIASILLAAGVIVALFGLRDARRTRDGELVTDLTRRWDEEATLESRTAYSEHGPTAILGLIERLYGATGKAPSKESDLRLFNVLIRWPRLIETIGVLHAQHAISTEVVYKMWGPSIVSAWATWRKPAERLRVLESYPGSFKSFEKLAIVMQRETTKEARPRRYWLARERP